MTRDDEGHAVLTDEEAGQLATHLLGTDDLQGSCLSDYLRETYGAGAEEEAVYAWVMRRVGVGGLPAVTHAA